MRSSKSQMQDAMDELQETIQEISDLTEQALDPELSREEVISKLKEIQQAASGDSDTNACIYGTEHCLLRAKFT